MWNQKPPKVVFESGKSKLEYALPDMRMDVQNVEVGPRVLNSFGGVEGRTIKLKRLIQKGAVMLKYVRLGFVFGVDRQCWGAKGSS